MASTSDTSIITDHELAQVERANASGLAPVAFVHGLWLLPSSWDRWATLFEEAGYTAVTPGWPDDPETVEEAKAHPGGLGAQDASVRSPITSRRSSAGWTGSRR